jgi:D-inositol-3-phosphate glycosyltransferase
MMPKFPISVAHLLLFFPRGGSAQVIRYLAAALEHHQVDCQVISGSLGEPDSATHALRFFRDLDVLPVDYTAAFDAYRSGRDPLLEPIPMHPSYEDRPDVADRAFPSVDPDTAALLEGRWKEILRASVTRVPDVFHIHHLSPMQAAVKACWPDVPRIGHIHGTEIKMLDRIRERRDLLQAFGLGFDSEPAEIEATFTREWEHLDPEQQRLAGITRWASWRWSDFWERRLIEYAAMSDRLIVLTENASERAATLLAYDPAKIQPVPNGVDIERFSPDRLTPTQRLERWKHWLVDRPRGWDETGEPGSVRYTKEDVNEWFVDAAGEQTPVLFYVGRFTSMKRVPMLIRAYRDALPHFRWRAPLVIWGGNPGEWEGEHPHTVAMENDVDGGVFFVGWRGHSELPAGLNAADVMIAPSNNEPFGQVYLEAMACQLPVVGTESGGPPTFINKTSDEPDGWLIPPDDQQALTDMLIEVVNNPDERLRRGRQALETVRSGYSWTQVAGTVRDLYDDVLRNH